ncbi:MAG: hypothetical protein SCARUB_04796 [Candidatus Scalindua rubra]|uniref:Uncharacterized protein n=1 Tax=Candidatus Scalindua rubra TaxID=1872076 RepID=A0A1E3X353_9BACT|nr:MAG: hypothetical protein SCARUB_04796 [Candidatus Scalindua rubra]
MSTIDEMRIEMSNKFEKFVFKMASDFEKSIVSNSSSPPDALELYYFTHFVLLSELADSKQDGVLKKYSDISLQQIVKRLNIKDVESIRNTRQERFDDYLIYRDQIKYDDERSESEKFFMYVNAAGDRIFKNNLSASLMFDGIFMDFISKLTIERQQLALNILNGFAGESEKKQKMVVLLQQSFTMIMAPGK